MRKILSLFLVFSLNTAYAVPPVAVNGETQANAYVQNIKVPNGQATKIGGIDSRLETGNTNLLTNPSFEHSTVTTGWTITNATATADTTNQVEGKKALSLALTGALSVVQDSTINAANLVGLQGVARIKVKTSDVDGLKVCARNAGVTSTSLCINIPKDGMWKEINIPYILTATSNGIAITSTGTSGTVKLDDAFIGTSAPFQGVNGAKLVGTLSYSPALNCIWQTASATFANFAADTDCSTPTVTGNIKAPSTKIPAIVLPTGSQPGTYLITAKAMFYKGTAGYATYRFSDGTNSVNAGSGSYADNTATGIISGQITYSTSINSDTTIQIQGKTATGNLSVYSNDITDGLYIEVYYFPPESKIYSQASQDYAYTNAGTITIGATTTAPTKGTIVTDRIMASRKGQNLIAEYQYEQSSNGTAGSGDYLFSLPNGLSFDTNIITPYTGIINSASFNAASKAIVGTGGTMSSTTSTAVAVTLVAYSSTQFRVIASYSSAQAGTVLGGMVRNSYFDLALPIGFHLKLNAPIQGWQDYGVIVGSFAGIEKCANDYECTSEFTAYISATNVVSNENIDWINGNCTTPSGTQRSCTYNTNLKDGVNPLSSPMNCTASAKTGTGYTSSAFAITPTTTGFIFNSGYGPTGEAQDIIVHCQKGTNDYKPKTAKVATSIGVPTVPNPGTKAYDIISFSYGSTNATTACTASPCSYLDQLGTGNVTSVTRASTGSYTANFSKTYSKLKCSGSFVQPGTSNSMSAALRCESCSSLPISTTGASNSTGVDTVGTINCIGEY